MRFPIGIQSFEKLIKAGYLYVDKTELIYKPEFWIKRVPKN